MAASSDEQLFTRICSAFDVKELTNFQKQAITSLIDRKDVFLSSKTGSGKSLVYECAPVVFGRGTLTVIIAPLTSIMKQQVQRLNKLGFCATYVDGNSKVPEDICIWNEFIFGSPELLVGTSKWRDVLKSAEFKKRHILTVVDEAHTVVQWGEGHMENEDAFRKWFANIGELRSLSIDVPMVALTATASPTNRKKIIKSLCLKADSNIIVDTPDRHNIKISVKQISATQDIEKTFRFFIKQLNSEGQNFDRHLIFCTSIRDCSLIYTYFAAKCSTNTMFNMYHSKTPETVKEKIRLDMENENGQIRILVCTNAAGMGVNFKNLHNIIHYGVPRDMDTFVQQMGRAGRDGLFSQEIIIFKKHQGQLKKLDHEMLNLVKSEDACRRKILADSYITSVSPLQFKHLCCDVCEQECDCSEVICPLKHSYLQDCEEKAIEATSEECMVRDVSEEELKLLENKLKAYVDNVRLGYTVVSPAVIRGFTLDSIQLVVKNASKLFNVDDIMEMAAIWNYDVAADVLKIINEVFQDVEMYGMCSVDSDSN